MLPIRMLGQSFVSLGEIVYSVWQILTGDVSLTDGLKAIGGAVLDFLITPFEWAQDVVGAVMSFVRQSFGSIGSFFTTAATQVAQAILNMPIIATLRQMLATVRDFFAGDLTFFESGKRLMKTLGDGILAAASYPYEMLKKTLGKLRDMMPFSDAKEGPLSQLTASGSALLKTVAEGMSLSSSLPGKAFSFAAKGMLSALSSVGASLQEHAQSALSMIGIPLEGAAGLWASLTGKVKGIAAGIQGRLSETVAPIIAPRVMAANPEVPAEQQILNAVLRLIPQLETRLLPKALGAALLLSPVLAEAAPEQQSTQAVNSRTAPDLETQVMASAPQLAVLPTMYTAIQGRVIAEPLQSLNADIAATLHPAMPAISPPDIALGLQPQLRALPPVNIPGVITAAPPKIADVAVPGTLDISIPDEMTATVAPEYAPQISPIPERFTEYQQPRQPAKGLSVFRDQPADSFNTVNTPAEDIRPLMEALLSKIDGLAERPIDVMVTTQLDGRKIAESVYKDLREQRIRNYETL